MIAISFFIYNCVGWPGYKSQSVLLLLAIFPPVLLFHNRQANSVWLFVVRQNCMFSGSGSLDRTEQQKHMDEGNGGIFSHIVWSKRYMKRSYCLSSSICFQWIRLFHLDFYRPEHIVHAWQSVQIGFMNKKILSNRRELPPKNLFPWWTVIPNSWWKYVKRQTATCWELKLNISKVIDQVN